MLKVSAVIGIAGVSFTTVGARGDIAYDAITGLESRATLFVSADEWAANTLLDPSAPLTLTEARFSVWSPSMETYTGTMWVAIYADDNGAPGARIAREMVEISVASRTDTVVTIPFDPVDLPGRNLWTSWFIEYFPNNSPGVNITGSEPTVGDTTHIQADRRWLNGQGVGAWSLSVTPRDAYMIQLITVPTPMNAAAILMLGVLTRRRRNGRV